MTRILFTFFLFAINIINAQVYVVKDDAVYYYDKIIKGADPLSFDIIKGNNYLAKDKNNVYYKGIKTNYDASTFEIKRMRYDNYYLADKNDIYIGDDKKGYQGIGSNSPKDFNILNKNISVDNDKIYWNYEPIYDADVNSLLILSRGFYKDKNNVYFEDAKTSIPSNNIKFFPSSKKVDFLGAGNSLVDYHGYHYKMNSDTFKYINFNYSKDDEKVLYRSRYLKADTNTFTVPNPEMEFYAKDNQFHFYLGDAFPFNDVSLYVNNEETFRAYHKFLDEQIRKAFKKSNLLVGFEVKDDTKEELYVFPKSNNTRIEKGKYIYINDIPQLEIDTPTFEIFNNDYAKDKNYVYLIYETDVDVTFNIIKGANPKTFKILKNDFDAFCLDDKHVYRRLDKIEGADSKSFEIINRKFAKDKNNLFYRDVNLKGIKYNPNIKIEELNNSYFTIGKNLVYKDYKDRVGVIKNVDKNSIKLLNEQYALVHNQIIFEGKKVGVLSKGETVLFTEDDLLTTSKGNKYINGLKSDTNNRITRIDKADFLTNGEAVFYEDGTLVPSIKLSDILYTVHYKNYIPLRQNKVLYGKKVFDADVATFEMLKGGYTRDAKTVFYKGEKTNYDSKTFHVFDGDFTLDKNGVYYQEKKIQDVNLKTFNVFKRIGFDDTYFYYRGKRILKTSVKSKM